MGKGNRFNVALPAESEKQC